MCLVALSWKAHPRWRLLMAGNRDEFHGRPTAALQLWEQPAGLLAGRDLSAGGTWMAASQSGRAAVVTNVRQGRPLPSSGPSRGRLAIDFLARESAVVEHAATLLGQAAEYAPFNLLIADAKHCIHVGNRPQAHSQHLSPGVHAISNGSLDAPWPKVTRLHAVMRSFVDDAATDLQPLWTALADAHVASDDELPDTGVSIELERKLSAAFIRGEDYGTRASTIIAIDHDGTGFICERRFGSSGEFLGETRLAIGG